uniref:Membrane magnesium transporter n=1 Tax=Rhizophora mucronata TaxID=61149 RepID=A0A2P2JZQ2_RHIMU
MPLIQPFNTGVC